MKQAEQNLPEAKKQGHSLLEQGQEYWNQATNYVHEQSQNLLNKGTEGAAEGSEQGESTFAHLSKQAQKYASDAMQSVSNTFHQAGDKAAEGAEQAHPNESYLEAARRTANDAISNVQNYFSGSSAGSAPSAGK